MSRVNLHEVLVCACIESNVYACICVSKHEVLMFGGGEEGGHIWSGEGCAAQT